MAKNSKEVQRRADAKRAGTRTRLWTCIVYPTEGDPPAPENWRDIIDEEHIEWVESPLHDKDINPDGTIKKPHIHLLLLFESVKTFEQVKEITDKLNGPIPQKCNGAKGLVRYMAHLDNPEKAQYPVSAIIGHGGADVSEFLKPSAAERYQLIGEMMDYVKENCVVEMVELLTYAQRERFDDWFPLLCDNSAYIMEIYVRSLRHSSEQPVKIVKVPDKELRADSATGEVIESGGT